jgi:phosphate-selective porin OprO and OprP
MKHDTSYLLFPALRRLGLAFLVAWPSLTSAVAADDSAIEARLQALETQLKAVQAENRQLRQELGLDGKAGLTDVKPAGKEPVLAFGGLVQAQAEFGDKGDARFGSANDRFFLRRARLNASGRFLEEFDFKIEGEFANSLAGSTTAASAVLTDGFINWSRFTWANVKVGQFKTPFGYEFLYADPKLLTPERSLGTDRLTLNRQVGVQVNGDFFDKQLGYAVGAFNGNGANTSANDNDNFNTVGRVFGTPWQGRLLGQSGKLTAGANAYASHDTALSVASDFGLAGNSFIGNRVGLGADAQFNLGRFDLWTEYLRVRFRPTSRVPAANFFSDAWYVQGSYFLLPASLQAVVRYETSDPSNVKFNNETATWTFGVNLFIKGDDLKLQCDYLRTSLPGNTTPEQGKLILRAQTIF